MFKLRLVSPAHAQTTIVSITPKEQGEGAAEQEEDDPVEDEFLLSKKEMEDLVPGQEVSQLAHAPHWPKARRPQWWCFLADMKTNKMFVYPTRITDIPHASPTASASSHDYRTYKMQFQAPQHVGTYTLRLMFISDTFVGEEVGVYVQLKVDDVTALRAEEQLVEDDISDPEEDTIAGQMAAMRGGKVKPSAYHGDQDGSDDESSTDEEESSDSDSSDDD